MVTLKHFLQLGCMLAAVKADCTKKQQPVVDLGYEIYQATGANNVGSHLQICISITETNNE